jgi:hypothetical protein
VASPSWAECATQLKNGIKPHTDFLAHLATQISNWDTAEQSVEGDHLPAAIVGGGKEMRRRCSGAHDPALARNIWVAWMREVCALAGFPERDIEGMAARIHRYMHTNSYTFNDRNWTRGAPSAGGSNVGNGELKRLTVDHEGYNCQLGSIETKTIEIVRDQNLGVYKNAEIAEVRGIDRSQDNVGYVGSGVRVPLPVLHAGSGDGGSVLLNASFDTTFVGTGTDKVSNWTIGTDATKVTAETTNYYTAAPGSSQNQALAIAASTDEISQKLNVRRIDALGERVPWITAVPVKKSAAGVTGTVTLRWGSKTQAFDLSTYADTNWHVLVPDMDEDLYYHQWKEDEPDVAVAWASVSAEIYVGHVIFKPMTRIDGTWWSLLGGSTAFLLRDLFTAADSGAAAADAEMMYSAWWAGLPWFTLPTENTGSETITDP